MSPPLELSEMFLALAARDDPPTVLDKGVLARLANAGVETLEPLLREVERGVEIAETIHELDDVEAIFVAGPGLWTRMPLGDEDARVAVAVARILEGVERFDNLRRLRLAAKDMRLVEQTALDLRDRDGPARLYERMLETALVVTYARPYLESNEAGVGRSWWPTGDDRAFHDYVIAELRHPYHAHAGRTRHRTLVNTTAIVGIEGPPIFAEAWQRLSDDELDALADLARRQAERFEAEANRIGAELGEERDEPRTPDEEFRRLRRELAEREASERTDDPSNT